MSPDHSLSRARAFVWRDGVMRRLPTLGGGALWGGGIDNYALRYTDESDDHVYGGAGNDYTVRYDEGLDEIRNCERLRPF